MVPPIGAFSSCWCSEMMAVRWHRANAFVRAVLLTLLIIASAGSARAEKRLAVLIGNANYSHAGKLANPGNDVNLIASTLESVGFETKIFTNLDAKIMGQTIDDLARVVADVDVLVVYYAGHAIQVSGENYLIPIDAKLTTESSVPRQTISLTSLMKAMSRVPVSVLLLDACRNNPFVDAISQNERSIGRSVRVTRGLAVVRPIGDMLITYATLPNSVALDGRGVNSPFAEALARHIPTPNAEISVLMKRVTRDVLAKTKGKQRPQQLSQMQKEFYFKLDGQTEKITQNISMVLSVYPSRVTVGQEVALVADTPPSCKAAFVNVSPSGKATPIPSHYFTNTTLSSGHLRHEISPGTRYGLVVQKEDEKGSNTLGFFCEPDGLRKSEKVSVLKHLLGNFQSEKFEGVVDVAARSVPFRFQQYVIE